MFLAGQPFWLAGCFKATTSSKRLNKEKMADISESAESRQVLNELKGKMLALKEHL